MDVNEKINDIEKQVDCEVGKAESSKGYLKLKCAF